MLVSFDVICHRPRAVFGLECWEHDFFFGFVVVVHEFDLVR